MTKYKTLKIAEKLHRELKLYCVAKNISITEFIEALINKTLKEK